MHFEGSLSAAEAALRAPLYDALYNVDEDAIQEILADEPAAGAVAAMSDDGERPWLARAKRLLRHREPVLKRGAMACPKGAERWEEFTRSLMNLLNEGDEAGVHAYSLSEPWSLFRREYRSLLGSAEVCARKSCCQNAQAYVESQFYQGEVPITVKITPYS